MFGIALVNLLLSILTLSIYRFWGRTRVRRYLWGRTSFLGERIEYTGTGKELFLGFLIVLFLVILPLIAINAVATWLWEESRPALYNLVSAVSLILVLFLTGAAIYRARRYRLSRTVWRGIRATLTGSAVRYGLKYLGFMVLNVLSLGWTYPWMRMRLMGQLMNNTWFGDRRFILEGGAGPLYKRFALAWATVVLIPLFLGILAVFFFASDIAMLFQEGLNDSAADAGTSSGTWLVVPVLPLSLLLLAVPLTIAWYKVGEFNHLASRTRYEGLGFELKATFASLIWLVMGNFLIVVCTLGLGLPFAQMRKFRYLCDRLSIQGQADFEAIRQSSAARPAVGEGLAEAFDVGSV